MPVESKLSRTITTTVRELHFTNEELIVLLQNAGYQIPQACEVYVRVPGGGDWSNTDLDISGSCPLCVTWETVEEKTDG